MSSDSEPESNVINDRLGLCEVCGTNLAKYTCPKCEVKTCQIACVNIHKKELECDGIRDRTKFIRMDHFTDRDLLSDYRMLEECARFVYGTQRDEKKRFTRIDKNLPMHLHKMRLAAAARGTALQFLAQNFSRHAANTTHYHWKQDLLSWRVEWLLPGAVPAPLKFVDERCAETEKLSTFLWKYLDPECRLEGHSGLGYYRAAGYSGIRVLLKAERVRGSAKKFYELDPKETLRENLAGKCIVEFPIICIALKDHAYNFDIITSDFEDEDATEETDENKTKDLNQTDKALNDTNQNASNESSSLENKIQNSADGNQHNGSEFRYRGRGRYHNGRGRYHRGGRGRGRFQRGFHHSREPKEPSGNQNPEGQNADEGGTWSYPQKRQLLTEKFAQEKKMQLQKELKAEKKKRPKNLLFTTGYSSDESLSNSDGEK